MFSFIETLPEQIEQTWNIFNKTHRTLRSTGTEMQSSFSAAS